jgi:hypothetical protein
LASPDWQGAYGDVPFEIEWTTLQPDRCRRERGWGVIAGLPWTTWLLLAAATLPAVLLALAFYLTHRARR